MNVSFFGLESQQRDSGVLKFQFAFKLSIFDYADSAMFNAPSESSMLLIAMDFKEIFDNQTIPPPHRSVTGFNICH